MSTGPIKDSVDKAFQRIDQNSDGQVNGKEIKNRLGEVGIGAGFLGLVHSGAVDYFMDTFDKSGDKQINLEEFQGESMTFFPKGTFNEEGVATEESINEQFSSLDANKDNSLSVEELKNKAYQELKKEGASHAKTKADIAGKMGIDVLDYDRDGSISKKEFSEIAREASKDSETIEEPE